MRTGFVLALASLITFCSIVPSKAADVRYPAKRIEIDIGFPPGGGTDLVARLIAEKAKPVLGQDLVIVNKPGGAGVTAATIVSKAKSDGYLLGALTDATFTFAPFFDKPPYDPLNDFTFISQYGSLQCGVIVR